MKPIRVTPWPQPRLERDILGRWFVQLPCILQVKVRKDERGLEPYWAWEDDLTEVSYLMRRKLIALGKKMLRDAAK